MHSNFPRIPSLAAVLTSASLFGSPALAQTPAPDPAHDQHAAARAAADSSKDEATVPVMYTAAAVRDSNRSRPVQIMIERWSTDAEEKKVASAFTSDAEPAELARSFREMEAVGSFRTISGDANPIRYARKYADADGTNRLVLVTDNHIQFWEGASASSPGKPIDGYTVVEIRLEDEGEGEGKYSHDSAKADMASGRVMIEDYDEKPIGLIGVREMDANDENWDNK